MALPASIASALESWAGFYGHHQLVSVAIRYLHLAGLVVGGGAALAADRRVLSASRGGPPERSATVAAVAASHRVVVPALAVVVVTGLLMTASDTATFFASRLYWSKMALVGLLLLNGLGLLVAERAAEGERSTGWTWLSVTSVTSLGLWLAILFAGVWLTVAA
ncbi:MAG TPA: DUF6644 family protein [Vicinamibacteria bacterium]|nr:DUF6644 family protein [Vicinamibacteria bacterium]